jgi:hypothetical protein
MNNNNFQQPYANNNQSAFADNNISNQHQQQYNDIQQEYTNSQQQYNNQQPYGNSSMSDTKTPYTNDIKQPGADFDNNAGTSKNTALPDYGVNSTGVTPMEKEQQQIRQQQEQAKLSSGYPGVVGGTPADARGIEGYDAQGNPIYPAFIAKRHQIEQSLGPTCKDGGYHDLRMLLTTSSLLFAILIVPYCCGYRGKRVVRDIIKNND